MGKIKFNVQAGVTISIHATIFANTREDAVKIAKNLPMPNILQEPSYREEDESDETWQTSGELDGEARNIECLSSTK